MLRPAIFMRAPRGWPRPPGAQQFPFNALDDAIVRSGPAFDFDPMRQTASTPFAAVDLAGQKAISPLSGTPAVVTVGSRQALQVANAAARSQYTMAATMTALMVVRWGAVADNNYFLETPSGILRQDTSGSRLVHSWSGGGVAIPGVTIAFGVNYLMQLRFIEGAGRFVEILVNDVGFSGGGSGNAGGSVAGVPWTFSSDAAGCAPQCFRAIYWNRDMAATPDDLSKLEAIKAQLRLAFLIS